MVIKGKGPEPIGGWCLIFCKCDGVTVRPVETLSVGVEILIEVLRLPGCIDKDVGSGDCGTSEVISTKGSVVRGGAPAIAHLNSPVAKLQQRFDQLFFALRRLVDQRFLKFGIVLGYCDHGENSCVLRFFTRQRRRIVQNGRQLIEEFLRKYKS